ncbi:MAG: preprotein translocase subunit YajC [Sneathiella sp.]|nr:MAG: preprotein translocase subunit YajC [Sneathiella sp.]
MDQLTQFAPLILIGVVFYFLLIRPQQKKAKNHRAMIDAVRRGDQVVTQGGIMGKVTKVRDDNVIQVEVAPDVRIDVIKSTLADVKSKSEPAPAKAADSKDDKADDNSSAIKKLFKK